MPKNKGKGGKNRRRGKNENESEKRELIFKEDEQVRGRKLHSNAAPDFVANPLPGIRAGHKDVGQRPIRGHVLRRCQATVSHSRQTPEKGETMNFANAAITVVSSLKWRLSAPLSPSPPPPPPQIQLPPIKPCPLAFS